MYYTWNTSFVLSCFFVLDKLEALERTTERLEHNGTRAHIQNIEFKNLASQHGALECKN